MPRELLSKLIERLYISSMLKVPNKFSKATSSLVLAKKAGANLCERFRISSVANRIDSLLLLYDSIEADGNEDLIMLRLIFAAARIWQTLSCNSLPISYRSSSWAFIIALVILFSI